MLHAHLPFVRHPEEPRCLEEEWLFEALTETYVPLVRLLDGLVADGIDFRLTLSVSPPLAAMLVDPLLVERFDAHLGRIQALAEREVERTRGISRTQAALAGFYVDELASVADVFRRRCRRDVTAALREHAEAGHLELITTAATHGLLAAMETGEAVRAQVRIAVEHHERLFGRPPTGFWLPECAYVPGLELHLKDAGVGYTFVEAHGLREAQPPPRRGVHAPVFSPAGVAFFARDTESADQVWSAESGYPADPEYREFYRDVGWDLPLADLGDAIEGGLRRAVGIKYHRITGPVDLSHKQLWDPVRARERAREHAAHFLERRREQVEAAARRHGGPVVVTSPYDAELFGHWWFEGLWFLDALFRRLSERGEVVAATPVECLERVGECDVVLPAASTWGEGGHLATWLDPANDWVYPHLDAAAARMSELARRFPEASGVTRRALNQAARELLLAQSSDWAFIMKMGTTVEYARRRTREHVARFHWLWEALGSGEVDEATLASLEERDGIFPDVDYRVYT